MGQGGAHLFGTCITCMDGRIQEGGYAFLKSKWGTPFVDTITAAGPVKAAAQPMEFPEMWESFKTHINISVEQHGSRNICLVAHNNCAGFPVADDVQLQALQSGIENIAREYPHCDIIGVFITIPLGDDCFLPHVTWERVIEATA